MRAGNISICIPNMGCNKNCEYCVSKMTGMMSADPQKMKGNVRKVKKLADQARVFSILLTGKGEPLCNKEMTEYFIETFSEYSVELQTNGIVLAEADRSYIKKLYDKGLDIVAISVDDLEDLNPTLLKEIHDVGMMTRITFNVTNKLHMPGEFYQNLSFFDLIETCKETGNVDQMTIRNIVVPNNTPKTKQTIWIEKNVDPSVYLEIEKQLIEACKEKEEKGQFSMKLSYGATVYDYEGIAVSYSRYCIQDKNKGENIRSLILMENGHI